MRQKRAGLSEFLFFSGLSFFLIFISTGFFFKQIIKDEPTNEQDRRANLYG